MPFVRPRSGGSATAPVSNTSIVRFALVSSGESAPLASETPRHRRDRLMRALEAVTAKGETPALCQSIGVSRAPPTRPQASSLLISIHDDRNRKKWSAPSGKSS